MDKGRRGARLHSLALLWTTPLSMKHSQQPLSRKGGHAAAADSIKGGHAAAADSMKGGHAAAADGARW
jgi:hypothetical protein